MASDELSLVGIEDPRQLRAMLVGRADTIAELHRTIDSLRARAAIVQQVMASDPAPHAANARSQDDDAADTIRMLTRALGEREKALTAVQNRLWEERRLAEERPPNDVVALQALVASLEAELADARHAILVLTSRPPDDAVPRLTAVPNGTTPSVDEAKVDAAARRDTDMAVHARAQLERLSTNHQLYRESGSKLDEENAYLLAETENMRRELATTTPLYAPSEFWEEFFKYNMNALTGAGLSNFKLTVNQNYQNYIPRSLSDPKVRFLVKWFLKHPSLRPLFSTIMSPDGLSPTGYLAQPGTQIFPDPEHLAIYKVLVTLGWDYVAHHDALKIADRLAEPELGNPIRVCYRGKLISQDLATSVAELTDFVAPLVQRIGDRAFGMLEIGGGYGRLAHAALSTLPVRRYVIVDIPPALHVSRWYLQTLFPDKTIFPFRPFEVWSDVAAEAEKADILFFLAHQIEQLPDGFVDLSVAVSSLHEMRLALANNYLQQMGRLSKHLIGSKQYFHYENPYDKIVIDHEEYVYPDAFERISSTPDRLNPTFFVDVLERRGGSF